MEEERVSDARRRGKIMIGMKSRSKSLRAATSPRPSPPQAAEREKRFQLRQAFPALDLPDAPWQGDDRKTVFPSLGGPHCAKRTPKLGS